MSDDTPYQKLLEVKNLTIEYVSENKIPMRAVENVSFTLHAGEALGLVGESGCGKTTLMLSLLRLLPVAGRITAGEVLFNGHDLLSLSENAMAHERWREIAIVFQGAMNALNPVMTVGNQITEALWAHFPSMTQSTATQRVDELLDMVGIASKRKDQYPFQFSGGMRQRVMIAMALACSPKILIADEPTTALDVMIQAQILELLESLRQRLGLAIILVTHDLGVVAELCDTVLVMYGGVTAEYGNVDVIYNTPTHPYTQNLIKAFPDLTNRGDRLASIAGRPPRLDEHLAGCRFAPRCSSAFTRCQVEAPPLYSLGQNHFSSCFLVENKV